MPRWLYLLLLAVPFWLLASALKSSQALIFALSAVALIPLAGLIATATETLAQRLGERTGGLLNATFGNAAELIIGLAAIAANLPDVVRASITGSIIGNTLLVLGTSMLVGGWRFGKQTFEQRNAGQYASFLLLAVIGLLLPSLAANFGPGPASDGNAVSGLPLDELSLAVAVILLMSYIAYIAFAVFGLRAHRPGDTRDWEEVVPTESIAEMSAKVDESRRRLRERGLRRSDPQRSHSSSDRRQVKWEGSVTRMRTLWQTSRWTPLILLAIATALTAVLAESLVGAIEPLSHSIGLSPFFVGLIIVPIVGNAAEHASAITMAARDRMEVAMSITAGSSIQVALFVAPILVLVSPLLGHTLDLSFSRLELVIFGLIAGLYALVCLDGESTWLEGLQLLAFYLIVALVAFFIPH